jgi:hypothetical protein
LLTRSKLQIQHRQNLCKNKHHDSPISLSDTVRWWLSSNEDRAFTRTPNRFAKESTMQATGHIVKSTTVPRMRRLLTIQAPPIPSGRRIRRTTNAEQPEPVQSLQATVGSASGDTIRSKVRSDLFKSGIVAVGAMVAMSSLQFIQIETAAAYLAGIVLTSRLALHSFDHFSRVNAPSA